MVVLVATYIRASYSQLEYLIELFFLIYNAGVASQHIKIITQT